MGIFMVFLGLEDYRRTCGSFNGCLYVVDEIELRNQGRDSV